MERKWGRGQAQGPINFTSMAVAFNWVHLRRPEVADGERWAGRWSPGEADVVGQHQLILLALLGLSQQDSGGSLFPSSFLEWEQLNKGGSRGQKVQAMGLLWPQTQAQHPCGEQAASSSAGQSARPQPSEHLIPLLPLHSILPGSPRLSPLLLRP